MIMYKKNKNQGLEVLEPWSLKAWDDTKTLRCCTWAPEFWFSSNKNSDVRPVECCQISCEQQHPQDLVFLLLSTDMQLLTDFGRKHRALTAQTATKPFDTRLCDLNLQFVASNNETFLLLRMFPPMETHLKVHHHDRKVAVFSRHLSNQHTRLLNSVIFSGHHHTGRSVSLSTCSCWAPPSSHDSQGKLQSFPVRREALIQPWTPWRKKTHVGRGRTCKLHIEKGGINPPTC